MADRGESALLERIRSIAREAGDAVMRVYSGDFGVELKDDRSPLTEADRLSHELITRRLGALTPALPVLSEEAPPEQLLGRLEWRRFWLVDPLDGTKEFIKRNGEFTVNIALIAEHAPALGVVRAPALDREYFGGAALGAWRADGTAPAVPIHIRAAPSGPVRVVGSRSHASPELARYLDGIGEHELKSMGSSLKICLVAEGEADVYPRLGPTSEWDTAAAQAVLEGAGGCMMDTVGQPLRYNRKEHLLNPHFLAIGDRTRDWLAPFQTGSR
jgi:3'(2'), 5'-bisphosphate nucleotidase